MDVNVTLAQLRTLTARCLRTGYGDFGPDDFGPDDIDPGDPGDRAAWMDDPLEALERVAALDEFLSRGGALPAGWSR